MGVDKLALAGGLEFLNLDITTLVDIDGVEKVVVRHTGDGEIYAVIDNLSIEVGATLNQDSVIQSANDERIWLSGTAAQGETLTIDTSLIGSKAAGADFNIKWQWTDDQGEWSTIANADVDSLALTQTHVDHSIRAVVSFVDAFGLERQYETEATDLVANVNDVPTGTLAADNYLERSTTTILSG